MLSNAQREVVLQAGLLVCVPVMEKIVFPSGVAEIAEVTKPVWLPAIADVEVSDMDAKQHTAPSKCGIRMHLTLLNCDEIAVRQRFSGAISLWLCYGILHSK